MKFRDYLKEDSVDDILDKYSDENIENTEDNTDEPSIDPNFLYKLRHITIHDDVANTDINLASALCLDTDEYIDDPEYREEHCSVFKTEDLDLANDDPLYTNWKYAIAVEQSYVNTPIPAHFVPVPRIYDKYVDEFLE